MDSPQIEKFLERIVKRRFRVYALTGFYLALALLAVIRAQAVRSTPHQKKAKLIWSR